MPWSISENDERCESSEPWAVIKDDDDSLAGCHETRESAEEQIKALEASESEDIANEDVFIEDVEEDSEEVTGQDDEEAIETDIETPEAVHLAWEGNIVFEDVETGDGRIFEMGSVVWDESLLPFPFKWQRVSAEGHDQSITIGRVDGIERHDDGTISGHGIILTGLDAPPESAQYVDLLRNGAAGGVSIDGDSAEFVIVFEDAAEEEDEEDEEDENDEAVLAPEKMLLRFSNINIRALTAVDVPAFAGARIHLVGEDVPLVKDDKDEEEEEKKDFSIIRNSVRLSKSEVEGILASAIPIDPPSEWFANPQLEELTPLTITDEGRVFGHLAGKDTCHIGYGSCETVPLGCDYETYFHVGTLKAAGGEFVNVGHISFGGSHAPLNYGGHAAMAHYDSTSTVGADIRVGEDDYGVWVAGGLRPGLSKEQIRELRAAPLSGDWRPINGKLQLIAAHAVNVPGYPISRAKVRVASGVTQTLIITEDCNCNTADEFQSILFQMDLDELMEVE